MERTLVSVVMITYAHEEFIQQAINSILLQEGKFDLELIVANDCSPDNTDNLIKEIIKNHQKSGSVKYTRHTSNKGMSANVIWALEQAQGKYIALCEGDDYWTDVHKIQKQLTFLENHIDYSLCCGGYISKNVITNENKEVIIKKYDKIDDKGFTFTLNEMSKEWITKTFTSFFRRDCLDFSMITKYAYFRDIHLFYHLMVFKKGYYFTTVFGVYNIHLAGVNSMQHGKVNLNASYNSYKELHVQNKSEFTRDMYLKATLALLSYDIHNPYINNTLKRRLGFFKEAIRLVGNVRETKWLLHSFFSRELKDKFKRNKTKGQ